MGQNMNFTGIKIFYWVAFGLSAIILPLNFGLGLIAMGIVILPILVLHLSVGLGLNAIKNHDTLIVVSSINLLTFALVRPDGVHAFTDSGLSAILELFGIYSGYNYKNADYFFFASLILLFIQVVLDLRLRKIKRAKE
jgi:hypothetical protein